MSEQLEAHKPIFANGLQFAYLESGEGPLVLLVHGFPDTAYTWDPIRPALVAAGYRTVAPFQRGYHPSEIPAHGRYDADTLGRDIVTLIEALGEKSAVVVGHDWGASAAYAAAAQSPERVRLLVTVAIPHPASIKPTPGLMWTLRHFVTLSMPGAAARIRRGDFRHIDELVQRWSPGWQVPPEETARVKESFAQPGCLEAALGYYRAISPRLPTSHKKRITVPAASFAGTDDMIDPSAFDKAAGRFAGSYRVIRMPGSHFMHRQYPEHFTRELLALLGEHAPASS